MDKPEFKKFKIAKSSDGVSIERYLLDIANLRPRTRLKHAFQEKLIRINGKTATRTMLVHSEDEIEVADPDLLPKNEQRISPNPSIKIEVCARTENFVAVNKKASRNCHPLKNSDCDTELNGLVSIYPDCALSEENLTSPLEGGLVHRIDLGTSGLLLAARNFETWKHSRSLFSNHKISKVYCAWVRGTIAFPVEINAPIEKISEKKMQVVAGVQKSKDSRQSITVINPLYSKLLPEIGQVTFVLVQIITGVRHQIRVILSDLGHPILNDSLYEKSNHHLEDSDLSPMPEKSQLVFGSAMSFDQTLSDRNRSPQITKIPQNAIFLHSLYLQSNDHPELENGIYAAPPSYFG